jgi:hypothetical protein
MTIQIRLFAIRERAGLSERISTSITPGSVDIGAPTERIPAIAGMLDGSPLR